MRSWLLELIERKDFEVYGSFWRSKCSTVYLSSSFSAIDNSGTAVEPARPPLDQNNARWMYKMLSRTAQQYRRLWWVFQILFDCVSDQEKKYRFACNTFFLLAAELWRSPVPIVFGGGGGLRVWPGRSRTQCFHVKHCLFEERLEEQINTLR